MRALLAVVVVTLVSPALAAPADAAPAYYGHRCRYYEPAVTVENTLAALREVRDITPRKAWDVGCEIDVIPTYGAEGRGTGEPVVHHDMEWRRVIDPDYLDGVPRYVVDTPTTTAVSLRTKGGARIVRWKTFIQYSAKWRVPLLTEWKWATDDHRQWVNYWKSVGARVRIFTVPDKDCSLSQLDAWRAAGARVGLKPDDGRCPYTRSEVARHVDFVVVAPWRITRRFVVGYRELGVRVFAGSPMRSDWPRLHRLGARVIASQPQVYGRWLRAL